MKKNRSPSFVHICLITCKPRVYTTNWTTKIYVQSISGPYRTETLPEHKGFVFNASVLDSLRTPETL